MHFWQTWRYIFVRKQLFSVWKSESDKQNSTNFFPKIYNSRSSYGHDECSFDNPVDKHSTKSRRFFAQSPKKMGKNSKRILLKIFLSPGEMQFWQPSQKTFGQQWKRSAQCRNKKTKVFHRNVFLLNLFPCATGKQAVSTTLSTSLSQIADDFLPNIWKL